MKPIYDWVKTTSAISLLGYTSIEESAYICQVSYSGEATSQPSNQLMSLALFDSL